jgi:hypothetical protein
MDAESLNCPSCRTSLDERELTSKTRTIESCPKCGTVVRTSEGFAGTDLAALIAGEVAEIDTWLDNYSKDTSQDVVKRHVAKDRGFLWAVGTNFDFAFECYYDQKRTGFVEIRVVTKRQAHTVMSRASELADLATGLAVQPYGVWESGWDITDGSSSEAVWGLVQYANVNTLNTAFLVSVIEKLSEAMQLAEARLLGEEEA